VTSAAAALTVNAAAVAPTITTQPVSQTYGGAARPRFHGGGYGYRAAELPSGEERSNIAGATSRALIQRPRRLKRRQSNGATFPVVVSNTAGTVPAGRRCLTVNAAAVAPTITMQPASQAAHGRTDSEL